MRGDFSRLTFWPKKHYSGVRMQQGRVQLDADWNEQVDIQAHLQRTLARDLLGTSGVPLSQTGTFQHFEIRSDGASLEIAPGRIYVDGILCENDSVVTVSSQPNLAPNAPIISYTDGTIGLLPPSSGVYLVYLDVWERHITALDDPTLREVALGGPDTATRTKVIWQAKLLSVEKGADCARPGVGWPPFVSTAGRLSARDASHGGYRGLENHLYRVEIHQGGPLGTATFKWSRDNATIIAHWQAQDGTDLTKLIVSTGAAKVDLAVDQWIELTDDARELLGQPGTFVQIDHFDGEILTIRRGNGSPTIPIGPTDFQINPKLVRWDSQPTTTVELPGSNDGWIPLEDGVEIRFEAGIYRGGDYWLIPARTVNRTVEWPSRSNQPEPQAPHGIAHHYCPLAVLKYDGKRWTVTSDCRRVFPPLTELVNSPKSLHAGSRRTTQHTRWSASNYTGLAAGLAAALIAAGFAYYASRKRVKWSRQPGT
jgi:hypothetical protein